MNRVKGALCRVLVIAVLIATWWLAVAATHSVIFPTPWDVVTGTLRAAAGRQPVAPHRRVAAACRCRLRTGRLRGRPAGTVDGLGARCLSDAESAFPDPAAHLTDRLDSDRHPVVRRGRCLAHLSDLHLLGVSDDRADDRRRAHYREALPAGRREFRVFRATRCSRRW